MGSRRLRGGWRAAARRVATVAWRGVIVAWRGVNPGVHRVLGSWWLIRVLGGEADFETGQVAGPLAV